MRLLVAILTLVFSFSAWGQQQTIAYWAQNGNDLPGGGFGFTPDSFPQDADVGAGVLFLEDFLETVNAAGAYTSIQSFGGSTLNALPGFPSGGSLSPQVGAGNGNNGMSIVLLVDTSGFDNIEVSWAWRATGTGFSSRTFAWSTDGIDFNEVATDTGTPTSFQLQSYDLSDVSEINDQPVVYFRITLDGATNANGNNRFDNILIEGSPIGAAPRFTVFSEDFNSDPFPRGWQD